MVKQTGQWLAAGLALLMAPGLGLAAEDATVQKLAEVQRKAGQVESYKADFTLTVTEQDKPSTLAGSILYQRPDKRRIEFTNAPGAEDIAQLVVSDGKTEWQYFPGRKVVNQTDWAKVRAAGVPPETLEVRGLHQPFIDVKSESIRFIEQKTEGQQSIYVFEADPSPTLVAEAPFTPGKLQIGIGAADGLTRWLTMQDANGREVLSQQYSKVQTRVAAKTDDFTFSPPEGVQVVDISEERAQAVVPTTPTPADDVTQPPATPAGAKP